MRPANIDLHIEELVLHGFGASDRYRIGGAVERELARLFAEQGASLHLAQGGEVAHLDSGSFEVARGARAETIGAQIAQTMHGRLSQ